VARTLVSFQYGHKEFLTDQSNQLANFNLSLKCFRLRMWSLGQFHVLYVVVFLSTGSQYIVTSACCFSAVAELLVCFNYRHLTDGRLCGRQLSIQSNDLLSLSSACHHVHVNSHKLLNRHWTDFTHMVTHCTDVKCATFLLVLINTRFDVFRFFPTLKDSCSYNYMQLKEISFFRVYVSDKRSLQTFFWSFLFGKH